METYVYELRQNRQVLNSIDVKVSTIAKILKSKDLAFVLEDEFDKINLLKELAILKRSLVLLDADLNIVYRSTETKGRNYKNRDNPGLIGDIRGNVERIRKNLKFPLDFIDVFVNVCNGISIKSNKRSVLWKATEHVAKIVEDNKELENIQKIMLVKPGNPEIGMPDNSSQLSESGNILILIMAVTTLIKSFLEKKRV